MMSRLRAPIAMRMPISRVRSVTDTSMIFMMPMPPTRSEMLGDAAAEQRHQVARGLLLLLRLTVRVGAEIAAVPYLAARAA